MSPHLSMILPLPIEVQYRQRWKSLYGDDIKNGGFNNTVKKENVRAIFSCINNFSILHQSRLKVITARIVQQSKLVDGILFDRRSYVMVIDLFYWLRTILDCAEYYAMYQENRPVERIVNGAIVQLNDEGREVCQEPSCHVNKSSRWRVGSKGERLCNCI